ncbi:hypothetical protein ACFL43_01430 [Thermodesulfobacteriota bacterium]
MEHQHIPRPRNKAKAEIRRERCGGREVIVKDYSRRHVLARLYGRCTLRLETRAYRRLAGLAGIPGLHGPEGPDVLVIDYIPSRTLNRLPRGTVPAEVFDRLDGLVARIHARGVAIVDLHGSNVLLTDSGGVAVVDFAHALVARRPERPGALVRFFMQLDLHAAARMRARYLHTREPAPSGRFGAAYRAVKFLKRRLRKIKKTLRI